MSLEVLRMRWEIPEDCQSKEGFFPAENKIRSPALGDVLSGFHPGTKTGAKVI